MDICVDGRAGMAFSRIIGVVELAASPPGGHIYGGPVRGYHRRVGMKALRTVAWLL
jgi:hypothetical protein